MYISRCLMCRLETVDGERQLISYADNWVDYMKLQANLTEAIETLTAEYQQYQACNALYQEGNHQSDVYGAHDGLTKSREPIPIVSQLMEEPDSEVTELLFRIQKISHLLSGQPGVYRQYGFE